MTQLPRAARRRNWLAIAVLVGAVLLIGAGAFAATRDSPQARSTAPATRRSSTPTTTPLPPTTTVPAAVVTAGPPYAVGVQHITLTDASRPTNARGNAAPSDHRSLPVALRYPAIGDAGSGETEGAAAATGRFPLVVFAHGYDIAAADYDEFTRDLAAQGFIVAAPDFPLSSRAVPGPPTQSDVDNQARDVSFLIASLTSGTDVPAWLSAQIAPIEAGVVGHSDGGNTAARVASNSCCFNARIGAAVVLSGDEGQTGGQWGVPDSAPMLLLQGTNDAVNPWTLSQRLYDSSIAPKWLVSIAGGDHLAPYTTGSQEDAIVVLVATFLHARLQDPGRLPHAEALANTGGLSLVAAR